MNPPVAREHPIPTPTPALPQKTSDAKVFLYHGVIKLWLTELT